MATQLDAGDISGCVALRSEWKHRKNQRFHGSTVDAGAHATAQWACRAADIVVECAPAALLSQIMEPVLKRGQESDGPVGRRVARSARGACERAVERGGQILVPSGALLGLDAVTAAAVGRKSRSGKLSANRPSVSKAPRLSKRTTSK